MTSPMRRRADHVHGMGMRVDTPERGMVYVDMRSEMPHNMTIHHVHPRT